MGLMSAGAISNTDDNDFEYLHLRLLTGKASPRFRLCGLHRLEELFATSLLICETAYFTLCVYIFILDIQIFDGVAYTAPMQVSIM